MLKKCSLWIICGLMLTSLSACRPCPCNARTKKDCYYSDYYQSSSVAIPDRNYYHSDPVR